MLVNWQLDDGENATDAQVINVLQYIMEIITQDIMVDGHK